MVVVTQLEKRYTTRDLAHWHARGVQDERERAAAAGLEAELFWGRSAEEIFFDRKAAMLREMEQAAERFHQREFGRPYVEFRGVATDSWQLAAVAA